MTLVQLCVRELSKHGIEWFLERIDKMQYVTRIMMSPEMINAIMHVCLRELNTKRLCRKRIDTLFSKHPFWHIIARKDEFLFYITIKLNLYTTDLVNINIEKLLDLPYDINGPEMRFNVNYTWAPADNKINIKSVEISQYNSYISCDDYDDIMHFICDMYATRPTVENVVTPVFAI